MTNLSVLTGTPDNVSTLQGNKFILSFPKLPFLNFFCQDAGIPGLSTSPVPVPTPFSDTFRHGDKMVFEPLTVNIIVDEDLRVWEEMFLWLTGLTHPENFEEYIRSKNYAYKGKEALYQDAVLTTNTNANNPNIRFHFTACHPISIGTLNLSSKAEPTEPLILPVTFRYDRVGINRIR